MIWFEFICLMLDVCMFEFFGLDLYDVLCECGIYLFVIYMSGYVDVLLVVVVM